MSATIISDEIFEVLSAQGAMFLHGMTYSGHPACAAAALANIAIMERESIPETVRTTGKIFEQGLRQLEDLDIVGQVRGSHFMMGLEFVRNKQTKALFDEEVKIGGRVAQAAQSRGLIIRPLGNMVVMSPPLVLTQEQIQEMTAVLRDSISAVIEDLKKDGNL